MFKKIFIVILSAVIAFSAAVVSYGETIEGDSAGLQLGDYILLGKYRGENILWRYVADDENGKLFWSDKFICEKSFGESNNWENSWIRTWLNSSEEAGKISYSKNYVSDEENVFNRYHHHECENVFNRYYENASGFLHNSNFSLSEIGVIKRVILKTPAPEIDGLTLAHGYFHNYGYKEAYCDKEELKESRDYYLKMESDVLPESIFLIDLEQMLMIQDNSSVLGDYFKNIACIKGDIDEYSAYWTRTPVDGVVLIGGVQVGEGEIYKHALVVQNYYSLDDDDEERDFILRGMQCTPSCFIRPAFYLDEENAQILSGSGTKDDPYVIDGKPVPERFEENGLYGYKDADGNVIVPAKYAKALPFSDGAALVATTEDPYHWRYIDTTGNYLFDKAFYASNNFNNGYALVLAGDEPIYRYIDKTGEWANGLVFEDAEDFCGGYARVKMNDRWGVVDQSFNFKVPCEYESKDEVLNTLQNK